MWRNYLKLGHPLGAVYYCSKVFGVLPMKYRSSQFADDIFTRCKLGMLITICQMILQIFTFYKFSQYLLISALARQNTLCFTGTYCCMFGIILSHTVFSFLVVFNVLFRHSNTIVCFNQAYRLTNNYILSEDKPIISSYMVFLFIIFIFIKVVITNMGFEFEDPFLFYSYSMSYLGPMLIINIVTTLSLVGEKAFEAIIFTLDRLPENKLDYIQSLEDRMLAVMTLNTYVKNISHTFGLDIFLVTLDVYLQLVLFLYTTIWSIFAQNVFPGFIWAKLSGSLEIFIIIFKLVYLCYQCDRVSRRCKLVIFKMQQLKIRHFYDPDVQILLNLFTLRSFCFKGNITSYGFFTIDLGLLVRISGIVLTYFLVLIQFQVGGEMQNVDASVKPGNGCIYWPCLKVENNF